MSYRLLIINPGSTSTKIGVYDGEHEVLVETLRHSAEENTSLRMPGRRERNVKIFV